MARAPSTSDYVQDDGCFRVMRVPAAPFIRDLSEGFQQITKVYKRVQNIWVEWVMVAESAMLRSLNIQGWGLYALKHFSPRQRIGIFGGIVQKRSGNSVEPSGEGEALQPHNKDSGEYSLQVRLRPSDGGGVAVIDGADGPPPFLHLINDAHRSTYSNNVRFDQYGGVEATKHIMPASDLNASDLFDLARSELLIPYQQGYWRRNKNPT
jgi:hypothetical protein